LPVALNGYTTAPIHYQTMIRIVNMSSSSVEVTLEAYQNDGTAIRILDLFPIAQPGTKTVFQIASGGSVEAFTLEDVPSVKGGFGGRIQIGGCTFFEWVDPPDI